MLVIDIIFFKMPLLCRCFSLQKTSLSLTFCCTWNLFCISLFLLCIRVEWRVRTLLFCLFFTSYYLSSVSLDPEKNLINTTQNLNNSDPQPESKRSSKISNKYCQWEGGYVGLFGPDFLIDCENQFGVGFFIQCVQESYWYLTPEENLELEKRIENKTNLCRSTGPKAIRIVS